MNTPHQSPPKKAGVMGWPVDHSLSPLLHGFWLKQLGIDGEYLRIPVAPEHFVKTLRALKADGFVGANVTVPHKETAMANVDVLDPLAKRIGAVNTIKVQDDGSLLGFNTDGFGFLENLKTGHPGFDPTKGPAVVLGAGGAARAVIAILQDAGAPEIRVLNRTQDRAQTLADTLCAPDGSTLVVGDWQARADHLDGAHLLVNTTTLGMKGQHALELDLSALPPHALVNDIVYVPLMTDLLTRAQARGNPVVDGLGMLLHQARPGFEAWFGVRPEVTPDLRAHVLRTMAEDG